MFLRGSSSSVQDVELVSSHNLMRAVSSSAISRPDIRRWLEIQLNSKHLFAMVLISVEMTRLEARKRFWIDANAAQLTISPFVAVPAAPTSLL